MSEDKQFEAFEKWFDLMVKSFLFMAIMGSLSCGTVCVALAARVIMWVFGW